MNDTNFTLAVREVSDIGWMYVISTGGGGEIFKTKDEAMDAGRSHVKRMGNHPNRSTWRSALPRPTPEEVRRLRDATGMTQEQAAATAGLAGWRAWAKWESGEARPPSQAWELWLLRTRMHPTHELLPRRGTTA